PNIGYGQYLERVIDGLCVSIAVLLGYYVAIELYKLLNDGDIPRGIKAQLEWWNTLPFSYVLPYPFFWPVQALAFLIGFVVVRDVRRVAHAPIVDDTNPLPTKSAAASLADRSPAPA